MSKKAIILLSGGLDSATCLAIAKSQGFQCYAISFDYGQRSRTELAAAKRVGTALGVVEHKIFQIDIGQFGGSALTDHSINVPTSISDTIPVTYVPARNTIFLSIALGWAEVLGARDIFIGANVVDYSGYPDCRPEYIEQFNRMANLAIKSAVEGSSISIHSPLIKLSKSEIISRGSELGLDYSLTISCYDADSQGRACGICESCQIRRKGFIENGQVDPTHYASVTFTEAVRDSVST